LKATIVEKMVEEAAAEQFGESDLDAHKYTMSNLTVEEIDEIKKEKAKLLKKANRPCSSCGVKGHWDKRFWMCINNENNKKNIDIADGKIVDDRKSKKPDDKKKIKSKSKKPPKKKAEGLASFTVKQLKEKLKSLGLPHSGNKPVLMKRLTDHAAKTTTSVTPGSTSSVTPPPSLSPPPSTTTAGHNLEGLLPLLPPQYVGDQHSTHHNIYCAPATKATKVPATVTDTPLLSPPPSFQKQSFHGDLTTHPPPEQEAESEDDSIVSFVDTTDSDDDDDKSIGNSSVADIDEMLDYLNLCERGLVTDTSPTQPPVLTHVEHNRDIFRDDIFLGIDDGEIGIAGLADPDELIELGAENETD
jgi:hypothetical protein